MRVSEVMTRGVQCVRPGDTIRDAARKMRDLDVGPVPVCGDNDKLAGMLTDRDIAIRAVAADKGPQTPIRDIMSKEVLYCFEDDEVDDVVQNMADIKVRRHFWGSDRRDECNQRRRGSWPRRQHRDD